MGENAALNKGKLCCVQTVSDGDVMTQQVRLGKGKKSAINTLPLQATGSQLCTHDIDAAGQDFREKLRCATMIK